MFIVEFSFIKRVRAVIFELVQSTSSPIVKFKFQRMSSKIERAFEEEQKNY